MADMTIEEMEVKARAMRTKFDTLTAQQRIAEDFAALLATFTTARGISLELANNSTSISAAGARSLSEHAVPFWVAYKQEVYTTVRAVILDRMTQLAKETRETYERTLRELVNEPEPPTETERKPRGVKLRKKDAAAE